MITALALFASLLLSSACTPPPVTKNRRGQVDGTAFEFSSAGDRLTDDGGAWVVRVRGDAMWVAWIKNGKTREYGTFKLSRKESGKLWALIDDARIHKRPPGRDYDPAVPVYSFTLMRPKKLAHTVTLRIKDARADDELGPLVDYLARLIKKYARKRPRLEVE